MRESWQQRETKLTQLSELPPAEAFAIIVRDGLADSAVCAGEPSYPALPAGEGRDAALAKEVVVLKTRTAEEGLRRVTDALRTYQKSGIPSPQRRSLMEEIATLTGDVAFAEVAPKCRAITPVPDGGPMTIAMLMANIIARFRRFAGLAGKGFPARPPVPHREEPQFPGEQPCKTQRLNAFPSLE